MAIACDSVWVSLRARMTLRDVSLVDKDVTVAIVKIEHVDSEKMVFLTIKRLKLGENFSTTG